MRRRSSRLREDVAAGIRWGLYFATVYGAFALVLFFVRGSEAFRRGAGVPLLVLLLVYYGAGIAGGAIVGALLPIGASLGGAIVLGWLGSAPAFFGFAVMLTPPDEERRWLKLAFVTVMGALLVGTMCGAAIWFRLFGGEVRRR
jgi:hypothetical protein